MDGQSEIDRAGSASSLPSYRDLVERRDAPSGSAWHLFDDEDLGTVSLLTPQRVLQGIGTVRSGQVFNLDYPINAFDPYPTGTRPAAKHTIFGTNPNHRDDYLDSFYLQSTSQVDGLRHMRHPQHGFYGGTPDSEILPGSPVLGIQHWAAHGIVGRGVLLDVLRFRSKCRKNSEGVDGFSISPEDLDAVAEQQKVTFMHGDILLLRTGWAAKMLREWGDRAAMGPVVSPGLEQTRSMVAWLWDHHFAAVAADNLAVEVLPPTRESDFWFDAEPDADRGMQHNGMIHRPLIALLGMPLGEMWALEELADHCASDGVYEFLVVCKPLNLVGGVGSTANALAIK